jgi:hypothetical protein
MEFMLHLWDELDDVSAACRHLTVSAVEEVAEISGAVTTGITTFAAFAASLLRLPG